MKRILIWTMVLAFLLTLVGCGTIKKSELTVLDLTGGWKQTNSDSETSYQIAMIADDTIEIYWKGDDETTSLFWAGTYQPPTSDTKEYIWESESDKGRTETALLASTSDTKTFTYQDGVISYPVTFLGITKTVELKRTDEVDIQVQKAVPAKDLLSLELAESGYTVKDGSYIQYAFIVKNPNMEKGVEFPKVRLTARDADGGVLATEDIVGSAIMPGGTWYNAFQGPSVDQMPASVDFEIIEPNERDWVAPEKIAKEGMVLTVENPMKRENKIVGEISNASDANVDSARVVVLFRDENGKLLAGESTFTDKIMAGGQTPFEISFWGSDDTYVTDYFEVYAQTWY